MKSKDLVKEEASNISRRVSGMAGAKVNLLRWVSMRTIKETFVPATDYRYPFLRGESEGI